METLDPVEHDVIEGRVADMATAAAPVGIGEAAVCGRVAPAAFSRRRQADTERSRESSTVACFELGANQLTYVSAPQPTQDPCRPGRLACFRQLQNKQREVIWQLKSDASH